MSHLKSDSIYNSTINPHASFEELRDDLDPYTPASIHTTSPQLIQDS